MLIHLSHYYYSNAKASTWMDDGINSSSLFHPDLKIALISSGYGQVWGGGSIVAKSGPGLSLISNQMEIFSAKSFSFRSDQIKTENNQGQQKYPKNIEFLFI